MKNFVAVAVLTLLAPQTAQADQIDGHWCRGLERLFIDGPKIVTPGGVEMTGEYDRHGFRYIAPVGDEHAGAAVVMVQFSDDLMQMTLSAKPDETLDWTRCRERISRAPRRAGARA